MRAAGPRPAPRPGAPGLEPVVAVCIASFRRPRGLMALLESLAAMELGPDLAASAFVLVVDNDAAASARPIVAAAADRPGLPLTYLLEPERNIALARNRGVREALRRGADFVAFVDDDEVARPDWLARLLDGQRRFGADVVVGAVSAVFPPGSPEWLRRGGFFQLPRHPTGTRLKLAQTSNVLVSAELLRGRDGPFDPAFGISGGSDLVFFAGHERTGARLVFVDEAVVEERIPRTRIRVGWILQRAFRVGNTAVHGERSLPRGTRRLGERIAKGVLRMAYGAVTVAPLSLVRGRVGMLQGLWNVAYGAGCLMALLGYRYLEYLTIHGD